MFIFEHGDCFQLDNNFFLHQHIGKKFTNHNTIVTDLDRMLLSN